MSDHEPMESIVAPWVLGALDSDDAKAMSEHVKACAACRETAARLRRVVGALPLAVDEVAPPERLRERILAAAAAPPSGENPLSEARPHQRSIQPRRGLALADRIQRRVPIYAAAAVAVVALIAGLLAGDLAGRSPAPTPEAQVARFTLSGHQGLAGAKATVIDLKSDGLALVDFSGLPMLASDRVYEVWLITRSGRPDPAAVFVPDSNGGKVVLVNRSMSGYAEMAITSEPGPDGSPAPTETPQLYGNLA